MKSIKKSIYKLIALAIALSAFIPSRGAERVNLITDYSQLSSNATDSRTQLASLLDNNVSTFWQSDITGNVKEKHYLQVDLGREMSLNGDDLVVYIQRQATNEPIDDTDSHIAIRNRNLAPVTFEVEVSRDGSNWEPFRGSATHVYFLFRGLKTKEYSTRITTEKSFRYIRFLLEANISRTITTGDVRCMRMAEFQLIQLGKDDTYTLTQIDRFRQIADYTDYNCEFENTKGVIDSRNRINPETTDGINPTGVALSDWCDWDKWGADGKWIDNLSTDAGIIMPDFSFIEPRPEDEINGMRIEEGIRQRTHYIEHDLYAMPGDIIALYPFYELAGTGNYKENFSHWYDYKTGGRLKNEDGYDLLDFLIDPGKIVRTENYGYFAGNGLKFKEDRLVRIKNADEFNDFASSIKDSNKEYMVVLENDLDFTGKACLTLKKVDSQQSQT